MSKSRREYVVTHLAQVEEDRRRAPTSPDEIRALIDAYGSPDPAVRAKALRSSCPCHVPWDVYEQLRPHALRLRRDPDLAVRAVAIHLEEDRRGLESMEAAVRRWADDDERVADIRRQKARRTRRDRVR